MNKFRINPDCRGDIVTTHCINLRNRGFFALASYEGDGMSRRALETNASTEDIERICGASNWLLPDEPRRVLMLPEEVLSDRLQKAAQEIALAMCMNGHRDWRFGPLAEREFCDRLEAENAALRSALVGLLAMYLRLANSGDAGHWNPEQEDAVIAARKALGKEGC